jgi:TRAP-type C4-dicarboxylate transport system substrate-binding protein
MRRYASALALSVALSALAVAPALAQAPVTLRFGHYQPRGPAVEGEGWFAEQVTKRTNGRVKIEVGWAEAYGKSRELPETVKSGAVDLATVVPHFNPDPFPFHRLSPMPIFASDPLQDLERQYQIASTIYRTAPFEAEMARTFNSKPLFQQLIAPYWALGKTPGCSAAVFQGKKVRTLGADVPKMFAAVGAVSVSLTTPELYEALQRGTVDYVSIPTTHMRTLKLHEAGKHACGPIFMLTMGHTTVINLDTWKKLAPDLQKIILDVAKETEKFYVDHLKKTEQADQDSLRAAGAQLVRLPGTDAAAWKAKSPDFLATWVSDMKAKGFGNEAEEVARQVKAILAK